MSDKTTDSAVVDYSQVPGVLAYHAAMRGERPMEYMAPVVQGGPVYRWVRLQPEQVVAAVTRLAGLGVTSAEQLMIGSGTDSRGGDVRHAILTLVQAGCRQAQGRARLAFPGSEGREKLESLGDERLCDLAQRVAVFNCLFGTDMEADE